MLEGYDWLKVNQPDLIISDINSAGVNSFEFIQIFKTDAHFQDTPTIFLTDFFKHNTKALREAKRLGAFACIAKPFRVEELMRRVREALKER